MSVYTKRETETEVETEEETENSQHARLLKAITWVSFLVELILQ